MNLRFIVLAGVVGLGLVGADNAQGLVLIPKSHVLAVGMLNLDVAFMNVDEVIAGKGKPGAIAEVGTGEGEISGAVIGRTDAGCSPVRETSTKDGETVYITARGDNRVLAFDAELLTHDADNAFLRGFASGGEAPVGLRLFAGGKMLAVANSNRFAGGAGNVTVFDLADETRPVVRQTIKTGEFPRNISASGDGETLYVTVYKGDQLLVLRRR